MPNLYNSTCTPPSIIVTFTVVTSPSVSREFDSSLSLCSSLNWCSLFMTLAAFSAAVFSKNLEPWPGLPWQTIRTQNLFLSRAVNETSQSFT